MEQTKIKAIKQQLKSYLKVLECIAYTQGVQREERYNELQKEIRTIKGEIINYVMDKIN